MYLMLCHLVTLCKLIIDLGSGQVGASLRSLLLSQVLEQCKAHEMIRK